MDEDSIKSLPIIITKHAISRVKERFNLGKKAVRSLVEKAISHGSIQFQKGINNEISISVLHNDRLFKFIVYDDYLLCATVHHKVQVSDPFKVRVKGQLIVVAKRMNLKGKPPAKKGVYRNKHNIGV